MSVLEYFVPCMSIPLAEIKNKNTKLVRYFFLLNFLDVNVNDRTSISLLLTHSLQHPACYYFFTIIFNVDFHDGCDIVLEFSSLILI